jgi:hypothetical protein
MWPFTSRRIFGNRWWAVAFVVFVCWQVSDLFGDPAPVAGNAAITDISGAPVDDEQMRQMTDTLNTLHNSDGSTG